MTEIISEKLKIVNNAIKADKVSPNEMSIMGELEGKEFAELVDLCKSDEYFHYMMKIYFTAYDTKCVKKAEEYTQEDFINEVVAHVWYNTAIEELPEDLCEAYMGFSLLGTDLSSRIRKGLKSDAQVQKFDEQIEGLIFYLCGAISENEFFNTFTGSSHPDDLKDTDYLKNRTDTVDYVFAFRDSVLKARDIYKYNDLAKLGDQIGTVDKVAYSKLHRSISSWTPDEFKKISFLNKELYSYFVIDEEESADTAEVVIVDESEEEPASLFDEVEEEGILNGLSNRFKSVLNKSDTQKTQEINKPKTFRDLTIESNKKDNSGKLLIGGILVIVIIGYFFITMTKAKDKDIMGHENIISERKPISVDDVKINDEIKKEVTFIEEE